jgi:hypothetical protein
MEEINRTWENIPEVSVQRGQMIGKACKLDLETVQCALECRSHVAAMKTGMYETIWARRCPPAILDSIIKYN